MAIDADGDDRQEAGLVEPGAKVVEVLLPAKTNKRSVDKPRVLDPFPWPASPVSAHSLRAATACGGRIHFLSRYSQHTTDLLLPQGTMLVS